MKQVKQFSLLSQKMNFESQKEEIIDPESLANKQSKKAQLR